MDKWSRNTRLARDIVLLAYAVAKLFILVVGFLSGRVNWLCHDRKLQIAF